MRCKLLIVGFDAMDGTILLDQVYAGRWITFESLYKQGNAGICWAEVPDTGPSWTTIYTGQPSEVHGVTDFWGRTILNGKSFVDVDLPFLWDWVNAAGLAVGIINLPVTYPPRQVNSYMISGFPAPKGTIITHPPDLSLPDDYVVDYINLLPEEQATPKRWFQTRNPYEALEQMKLIEKCKLRALQLLPLCDLMAIQFTIVDRIGHMTHHRALPWLLKAYDWCDYLLGKAIAISNPDTVVVVSDHGFDTDDHTHSGIFIAKGPGLVRATIECQNLDVLPQALEILKIDQKILPGKSHLAWKKSPRPTCSVTPTPSSALTSHKLREQNQVKAQLRALGYL